MFRGFDRPSAARFAFFMSVPVLLAAGGYEMLDVLKMPNLSEFLPLLAGGIHHSGDRWLVRHQMADRLLGKGSL